MECALLAEAHRLPPNERDGLTRDADPVVKSPFLRKNNNFAAVFSGKVIENRHDEAVPQRLRWARAPHVATGRVPLGALR